MTILTTKTVLPGQAGTKQLAKIYGDKLLAVRYKIDTERRLKYKTVEILVNEWQCKREDQRIPLNKIVYLRIDYGERRLGSLVRAAGGFWNKEKKYWELAYGRVLQLGLKDRIRDV